MRTDPGLGNQRRREDDLAEQARLRGSASVWSGAATPRIVIIGAGVSGICMGIRLRQQGFRNFRILEKAQALGGTWRDNTYPGLTVDTSSYLYSYSFEPNPNWSRAYPPREEVWAYYDRAARKYGVLPHIEYGKDVVAAHWHETAWSLRTRDGEQIDADIVVIAVSRLHVPQLPAIPGLSSFVGPAFHTARWDHDVPLAKKRVALIGTGSTAAQIISTIVDDVARLSVFQRTPQWVLPNPNPPIGRLKKLLLRPRFVGRLYYRHMKKRFNERSRTYLATTAAGRESLTVPIRKGLQLIKDPALREKLTPDYEPICKRLVVSDKFHAAIQRDTIDLVTTPIDRIVPDGIITTDGVLHQLDVLVLATGFVMDKYLDAIDIKGEEGRPLQDVWAELLVNYKTVSVPHMPNFFMVNGPYSPVVSTPVVMSAEYQVEHVLKLIGKVARERVAISPRPEATAEWLDDVRIRAKKTVFGSGGCQNYYLDKFGVPTINPVTVPELARELRSPDFRDYVVKPLDGA